MLKLLWLLNRPPLRSRQLLPAAPLPEGSLPKPNMSDRRLAGFAASPAAPPGS